MFAAAATSHSYAAALYGKAGSPTSCSDAEGVLSDAVSDAASSVSDPAPQTMADCGLEVGQATLKGTWHPNEDRANSWVDLRETFPALRAYLPSRLTLLLLCDGHDGAACANFIQAHAARTLVECIEAAREGDRVDWSSVLRTTFLTVEAAWTNQVRVLRATKGFAPPNGVTSGACCTAVLLYGPEVYVANVGDARCVVRRADTSLTVLTTDHRCDNPAEKARMLALGGWIRNNRVLGVLEPCRTIGDLEEKARAPPGVITAEPSVASTRLLPDEISTAASVSAAIDALTAKGLLVLPAAATVVGMGGPKARSVSARAGGASGGAGGSSSTSRISSASASANRMAPGPAALAASVRSALAARSPYATAGTTARTLLHRSASALGVSSIPRAPAYTMTLAEAAATASHLPITAVIVASDGVWDVLTTVASVAVVTHALALYKDAHAAAAELVKMAQKHGSQDDITAVVLWMKKADM